MAMTQRGYKVLIVPVVLACLVAAGLLFSVDEIAGGVVLLLAPVALVVALWLAARLAARNGVE